MSDSRSLSFALDIRPMFTDTDILHMQGYGLDLSVRDDVAARAGDILAVLNAGTMPPPTENRAWTAAMRETFEQWIEQGCLP